MAFEGARAHSSLSRLHAFQRLLSFLEFLRGAAEAANYVVLLSKKQPCWTLKAQWATLMYLAVYGLTAAEAALRCTKRTQVGLSLQLQLVLVAAESSRFGAKVSKSLRRHHFTTQTTSGFILFFNFVYPPMEDNMAGPTLLPTRGVSSALFFVFICEI